MWYISRSFLVEYYKLPSSTTIPIPDMVLFCLMDEINGPRASLENARVSLLHKNTGKVQVQGSGAKIRIRGRIKSRHMIRWYRDN